MLATEVGAACPSGPTSEPRRSGVILDTRLLTDEAAEA